MEPSFLLLFSTLIKSVLSHLLPVSLCRFRLAGDLHLNYIQSGWYGE